MSELNNEIETRRRYLRQLLNQASEESENNKEHVMLWIKNNLVQTLNINRYYSHAKIRDLCLAEIDLYSTGVHFTECMQLCGFRSIYIANKEITYFNISKRSLIKVVNRVNRKKEL